MTESQTTPEVTKTRNRLAKKVASEDGKSVAFQFSDGQAVTVKVSDFPQDIQLRFAQHGMSQKVGDSYAGDKTPLEARENVQAIIAQLVAGDWRVAKEGGAGPKTGKTVRAIFRLGDGTETPISKALRGVLKLKGEWTIQTVRDAYAALGKEAKATISSASEIKTELAKMAMEDAKSSGSSLLS